MAGVHDELQIYVAAVDEGVEFLKFLEGSCKRYIDIIAVSRPEGDLAHVWVTGVHNNFVYQIVSRNIRIAAGMRGTHSSPLTLDKDLVIELAYVVDYIYIYTLYI